MSKLRFRVVYFTSEEAGFPAEELNVHSPQSKGWQSVKFCQYPQELGFELLGGEINLAKIDFLSHQAKIATKIEVFIGRGDYYEAAQFTRLGFLSLDSNEKSNHQARELKTVYVDNKACQFVRFLIHKNYVNIHNHFNQVGVVAVNFHGKVEAEMRSPRPEIAAAPSSYRAPRSMDAKGPGSSLATEVNVDPFAADKIRRLLDIKQQAIDREDYVTAKTVKGYEQQMKTIGVQMAQLEAEKRLAVRDEDFDRAKEIKDVVDLLKEQLDEMVATLDESLAEQARSKSQSMSHASSRQVSSKPSARSQSNSAAPKVAPAPTRLEYDQYEYDEGDDMDIPRGKYEADRQPVGAAVAPGRLSARLDNVDEQKGYRGPPVSMSPRGDRFDGGMMDSPRGQMQPPGSLPPSASKAVSSSNAVALAGVPNVDNLAEPEEITAKSRELPEFSLIVGLIGEYRARCLFSKVWGLREAAVAKTQLLLEAEFEMDPGINACLAALLAVVAVSVDDKIQQVLFSGLSLLESVLVSAKRNKIGKSVMATSSDAILTILVEKMSDGNARIRDGAKRGIDLLSSSSCVGCSVVAAHVLKPLPPKHRTAWRPITARLQLLADLVNSFGVGPATGLSVDGVMNYVKTNGAFSHSNGEVREQAKEVSVAVYRLVGLPPIENYLSSLRKKQRTEYDDAFLAAGGVSSSPMREGISAAAAPPKSKPAAQSTSDGSKAASKAPQPAHPHHNHVAQGGVANTSASRAADKAYHGQPEPVHPPEESDHVCNFCGAGDASWDEDALDLHYLKDCPLLAACPGCAQVLEIAALPDHLLDECEYKDHYVPCDVTGLAIRADEYDEWLTNPHRVVPPENSFCCPLCLVAVDDTPDAWRDHLMYACMDNTRH